MKSFKPDFSLYWYATKTMGAVGIAINLLAIIAKLILLVRMNNQQCIPEMPMWEYFGITARVTHTLVYAAFGLIVAIIVDLLSRMTWQLKWNISIPNAIGKIIERILLTILGILSIFTIGVLIWGLFIKNPC